MNDELKKIDVEIEKSEEELRVIETYIENLRGVRQMIIAENSGKPYCPKCFTLDVFYIKNAPTLKMTCRSSGCFHNGSEEEFHYQC